MSDQQVREIRRALISVSDKSGVVELATALQAKGVQILSTGGTFAALKKSGIAVTEVSEHTGFPELMDGRVKTLHPKIHGGILGRRGQDEEVMQSNSIEPIDLVVVNLYPFQETIAQPDCTMAQAIENIDIGGPAMLRSAAKNHTDVLVVVDPQDYGAVATEISEAGGSRLATRSKLAIKAFRHTAAYDSAVAGYLGQQELLPDSLTLSFSKLQQMRYGENPHQSAAFYKQNGMVSASSIAAAVQLQGKELSFNNIADADAALECVKIFAEPACVIVKHANPCGVGTAQSLDTAYDKSFAADPTSAFGGIIAFNRPVNGELVARILDQQFVEVMLAPDYDAAAIDAATKKKNVRLLKVDTDTVTRGLEYKRVGGGLLVQSADELAMAETGTTLATKREPTPEEMSDLLFAWQVAWFVKSNAIVYAKDGQTVGVGAGQMARVTSAQIANIKAADAGLPIAGAVMASDAFFPFRDSIDAAAAEGITAVIQPGGSMRDKEVIAAADEHNMAMLFTGVRHFRH